jgi:hypothetical protein
MIFRAILLHNYEEDFAEIEFYASAEKNGTGKNGKMVIEEAVLPR